MGNTEKASVKVEQTEKTCIPEKVATIQKTTQHPEDYDQASFNSSHLPPIPDSPLSETHDEQFKNQVSLSCVGIKQNT
jgi:hypothetical protein